MASAQSAIWLASLISEATESPMSGLRFNPSRVNMRVLGDAVVCTQTFVTPPILSLRLEDRRTSDHYAEVVATIVHPTTLEKITHSFPFAPMLRYEHNGGNDYGPVIIGYTVRDKIGRNLFFCGSPTMDQLSAYFRDIYAWARLYNALPSALVDAQP